MPKGGSDGRQERGPPPVAPAVGASSSSEAGEEKKRERGGRGRRSNASGCRSVRPWLTKRTCDWD